MLKTLISGKAHFPHHKRKRIALGLTFLVLVAVVVSACRPVRPAEREGGTLVIGAPVLAEMDPHRARVIHPAHRLAFDTLLTRQSDWSYSAGLASEWSVSTDGREVTLQLRSGLLFHDGTRVDGPAVAINIERLIDGGAEQFPVRALLGPLQEVRASEFQVTLIYDHPFPPVWEALSDSRLAIASPASLQSAAGANAAQQAQARPDLVGSGPYTSAGRTATGWRFSRFDAYRWPPGMVSNTGPAYPDEVLLISLDNFDQTGDTQDVFDLLWWPAGEALPPGLDQMTASWRSYPFSGTRLAYLNCVLTDVVMADPAVRQAVRLLVDRDSLLPLAPWPAQSTTGLLPASPGGREPGETTGPGAGGPGPSPGPSPGPDPIAAADMLDAAGWVRGPDGIRSKGEVPLQVRLTTYEDEPGFAELAGAIGASLEAAGFEFRLIPPRRGAPDLIAGAPNMWLLYHDWPDADVLYYLFHSTQIGRANRAGYDNIVVDWYLEVARTEMDPAARLDFYREAQSMISAGGVAYGVLETRGELRVSNRVAGFRPHLAGELFVHDMYLRD